MGKTPSPDDALQAFPTALLSKPTAPSSGLLPMEQQKSLLWCGRSGASAHGGKSAAASLFAPADASTAPSKVLLEGILFARLPCPAPSWSAHSRSLLEPGKTKKRVPKLAAPSEGGRAEALLDRSSNNQNRYYCSQRMEK